jgi:anti-anti-sigma factor
MNLQIAQPENGGPLKIAGALDLYSADALREALLQCVQQEPALTLDLSAVTRCDPVALQLICAAQRSAGTAGKPFAVSAVSPAVTGALTDLGFPNSNPFNL